MIFVDANVILRYLAPTHAPAMHVMEQRALRLFEAVDRGEEIITTSEVVLHEVLYVLTSKRHYAVDRELARQYLTTIVRTPGVRFPRGDKKLYLRALELYGTYPALDFPDTIVAARTERLDVPLATFDEALARLPFLSHWTG